MQKNIIFLFFVIFASIFIIAFGMTTYRYYEAIHSDDPIDPYLLVEKGQATITRGDIAIDMATSESYSLHEGDIIITRVDSQALVAWPDHSTTRLGESSRLTIKRMRVVDDYSKIELIALLESGKAWSNIVRTLYGESRVEFHLPKNGTVAGVRGTVFEINLENNYIRSVDHSISLENSFGQGVMLLPGDAVRADNILQKISQGFDTIWISANAAKDTAYSLIRDSKLRDAYALLSGGSNMDNIWDTFVRWILSLFPSFQDISFMRSLNSGNLGDIVNVPQAMIMRWYQAFQSKDFVQERDQFRGVIVSIQDKFTNSDQIMDSLTKSAVWDIMGASGRTLSNTELLLDTYARKTGITFDTMLSGMQKINSNTLTESGRAIYEKLLK